MNLTAADIAKLAEGDLAGAQQHHDAERRQPFAQQRPFAFGQLRNIGQLPAAAVAALGARPVGSIRADRLHARFNIGMNQGRLAGAGIAFDREEAAYRRSGRPHEGAPSAEANRGERAGVARVGGDDGGADGDLGDPAARDGEGGEH